MGLALVSQWDASRQKKSPTKAIFECAAVAANLKLCCLATITDRSSVAWQPLPTQTELTPPQKFLLNNLQLADKRAEQAHVSLAVVLQHWGRTLSAFTHHCTFHFKRSKRSVLYIHLSVCGEIFTCAYDHVLDKVKIFCWSSREAVLAD